MNDASPEKPRRRTFGRTAATAAAVLGATLLAYPGTATAQTVDCAALGDNPAPRRIGSALDIAIACDIEVRVSGSTEHHATVFVTPEGQLHLVSTAEPVQEYHDDGAPDPVLAEFNGSLSQANSSWPVFLRYTDQTYPLIETRTASLDWAGETPVPDYSGTTAVYDELAAGLDLSVDVGISTFDLEFTAADADAWNALATGLRAEGHFDTVQAVDGSLRVDHGDGYLVESTTRFIVRDAAGETHFAHLTTGADGAVMVELLDQTIAEAAYPLTLTTQWANRSDEVNEWGGVTSQSPDLSLYRGEAGLDEPYFVAAGQHADTVAGAYCYAASGTECLEAEAAAYWKFGSGPIDVQTPSVTYQFDYPVTSAVFQVDAAEAANCVAPDLDFTEEYSTAVTWNDRPAVTGFAASGSCQAGTAVYDLTEPVANAWDDLETAEPITLGTAATAQTARFDGGSARLDVYFDIIGVNMIPWCSDDPAAPDFYGNQVDGRLYVETWREEVFDLGLTWTAKVKDRATGETVLTTEPEPVPAGGRTVGDIAPGLPQGAYEIEYEVASGTTDYVYAAPPCHVVVDTASPKPEIAVEPGSHRIGDTVAIEITLDEEDFISELDRINVSLHNTTDFGVIDSAVLTEAGTVVLQAQLTGPVTQWWVQAEDRAGNEYLSDDTVAVVASADYRDYNGDRLEDVMAVRKSDGHMVFYAGKGDGTFAAGVSKGAGWGDIDAVMAGDLNGDGKADLLGRDNRNGNVHLYPGNGTGGWGTRVLMFSGWNAMGAFTTGDYNSDGKIDLLAVKKSDGKLYLYPGNGNGTFGAATAIGSGWQVMDTLAAPGDFNDDGHDDLLARDGQTGAYYLYPGKGDATFGARVAVPASLDGTGTDRYRQVAGVGDVDGDNREDLLAVDSRTGELELHSLAANGTALHAGRTVATGWGAHRLPAPVADRSVDFNGDNANDVLVRMSSNATTYLYPGNGTGGFGNRTTIGTGFSGMNVMETAGDMTGDGFADLLARETSTGDLYVYPGNGKGAFTAARVKVGSGWNAFNMIAGGYDYNGDGKADILARETSTGTLWLYPGTGSGTVGARVKAASGWNAFRETEAVGDYDHDGKADVIAIKTADECMYLYRGNGDGTFKTAVNMGCGWSNRNAVTAVGDFDRDGHVDWLARRKSDGVMFLYSGNGASGYTGKQIATGWGIFNQIA